MASGDLIALKNEAGTDLFRVDSDGDVIMATSRKITLGTSGKIEVDTIDEKTGANGVDVDGCLIKDGRVEALATAAMFRSGERTATGAEESIAHGLAAAPTLWWYTLTELPVALGAGADILEGTNDATNLKVTVTANLKFRAYAIL